MTSSSNALWTPLVANSLPSPHFSYSPVVKSGAFIHVSGLVGLSPETGELISGGMAAETTQILNNVSNLCKELSLPLENLMLGGRDTRYYQCVWSSGVWGALGNAAVGKGPLRGQFECPLCDHTEYQ